MKPTLFYPWLNLLLVIVLVGPWPVLSSTADSGDGGCCMASGQMAEDMRHAGCGSPPDQEGCCMDQGCADSNCSVTLYIGSGFLEEMPVHAEVFVLVFRNTELTIANAPPVPPPIV